MHLSAQAMLALLSATIAILMLGTTHIKANLRFYTFHTLCLSILTLLFAQITGESHLYVVGLVVLIFKAICVPVFLEMIIHQVKIQRDSATYLPPPLSMHLGIVLLGLSYLVTSTLPDVASNPDTGFGATAAMSLIFTGMLAMVTRKVALSQIIGFLIIENGIFLFTLTQTHGMPMAIEFGVLLDVFVGVMVTGILIFGIKKNFEHIDVTQLTQLKD